MAAIRIGFDYMLKPTRTSSVIAGRNKNPVGCSVLLVQYSEEE